MDRSKAEKTTLQEFDNGRSWEDEPCAYNDCMIYYVEDDPNIRELALYALSSQGLDACGFAAAPEFRKACAKQRPDLVLLDIMLPGEDGLSILSWIRANASLSEVPVMMLTAKGTEFDKVVGLDSGADDYLAKPFGMMELVSRCKALLRRPAMAHPADGRDGAVTIGPISLSVRDHEAFAGTAELDLTLKEFDLLRKLMENPGRAFTRSQLLKDVWDVSFVGETRTVDTHVQTLRRKLNDACPGAGNAIETIRGVGYRFSKEG